MIEGDISRLSFEEQNVVKDCILEISLKNNFFVKQTKNEQETIDYLKSVQNIYQEKLKTNKIGSFIVCGFKEFSLLNSKTFQLTVRDLFCKQLFQIKGANLEKIETLLHHHPTPFLLYSFLKQKDRCSSPNSSPPSPPVDTSPDQILNYPLLSNTPNKTKRKRNVGKAFSKRVSQFYFK